MDPSNYTYGSAGFNNFLTKSLDDQLAPSNSLQDSAAAVASTTQEVNLDRSPTSGSLGSTLPVGSILLDGVKGRISVYDETGSEVVRLGQVSDG